MQMTVAESLLVLVFRAARSGRRANMTSFCQRHRLTVAQLQAAFDQLELAGLMDCGANGERLTLPGLAVAAALSRRMSERHRPLASCRRLAA